MKGNDLQNSERVLWIIALQSYLNLLLELDTVFIWSLSVGACNSHTNVTAFLQTDLFLVYLSFSKIKAVPLQWRH